MKKAWGESPRKRSTSMRRALKARLNPEASFVVGDPIAFVLNYYLREETFL